jgi:hypothetical protein
MPLDLQAESIGPVDVAVIMFDGNQFNGDVAPALADLHDSGTVRVIDVAFVLKDLDGTTSVVEVGDADVADAFERVNDTQFDLLSDEDLAEIAEGLQPSCSALVIVWENTWAARFAAAVRDSKGQLVAMERIPRENVLRAIAALDED